MLVRDLLLGEASQGPASWFGRVALLLTGDAALAVRLVCSSGFVLAMTGAALAAAAFAGRRAAPWAVLLTASWSLAEGQAWLLDSGTLGWGLAWTGLGLAWWGCARGRRALAALGCGLLVLGIATKPTALPVVCLIPVGPWLCPDSWRVRGSLAVAMLSGLAVALPLAWLLQGEATPWLAARAFETQQSGGGWLAFVELPSRGVPQGSFLLLSGLAALGAVLGARRRTLGIVVLLVCLLAMAAVGDLRAARLQPRHLLPVSLGLVVLVAAIVNRGRYRLPLELGLGCLCSLGCLDTYAWAHAWSGQRAVHAATAPSRLPHPPAMFEARYAELPWTVFHESSLAGSAELVALPATGAGTVLGLPLQERRDAHLQVAALLAGRSYAPLSAELCCERDELLADCAPRVVDGLEGMDSLLVLPGKREVVAPESRDFHDALRAAAGSKRQRAARWQSWRGEDRGGAPPCRLPRGPVSRPDVQE